TALAVGSGELRVLATPRMCALMEECAYKCIAPELEEGASSVGTSLNIKHLSATPVGMKVTASAIVTEIDGRKITFDLIAEDEAGKIGEGTHERFIVYADKFVSKTYSKLTK
ncbi:MAG: thioesterase family protein, partial [Clostridia bacterium]|nr:thioesterase family protein [Clostridia bacterium]